MNREEYTRMYAVEPLLWWYRGLHANLLTMLSRTRPGSRLLDAGCGTGGFLFRLREAAPQFEPVGIDIEPLAARLARERSERRICVGSVGSLPFPPGAFDTIVSADVLYHARVDETAALGEFHRCLAPGGVLILNLPAYEWLRGAHDRAVHGARRYTARRVADLLRTAGFAQVRTTYWNTILFPLMVLKRKLGSDTETESDVMLLPRPVEALFRLVMQVETLWLRTGLRLPFGGSVLAIGVKHG
jgi:SAM-dependent methyltransferase